MKDILYIAYCKYQHCIMYTVECTLYMYKLSKKCWLESDQVEEYWCSPKCPNVFVYVTISGEPISSGPPFSKKGKICKFGGTLGYFYKFSSHSILPKSDFFKSAFVLQCEKKRYSISRENYSWIHRILWSMRYKYSYISQNLFVEGDNIQNKGNSYY